MWKRIVGGGEHDGHDRGDGPRAIVHDAGDQDDQGQHGARPQDREQPGAGQQQLAFWGDAGAQRFGGSARGQIEIHQHWQECDQCRPEPKGHTERPDRSQDAACDERHGHPGQVCEDQHGGAEQERTAEAVQDRDGDRDRHDRRDQQSDDDAVDGRLINTDGVEHEIVQVLSLGPPEPERVEVAGELELEGFEHVQPVGEDAQPAEQQEIDEQQHRGPDAVLSGGPRPDVDGLARHHCRSGGRRIFAPGCDGGGRGRVVGAAGRESVSGMVLSLCVGHTRPCYPTPGGLQSPGGNAAGRPAGRVWPESVSIRGSGRPI